MNGCRACGEAALVRVLDLGEVPPAKHFPLATDPVYADEVDPLAMDLCQACGLAQLADDDTVTDEPRGMEPQALLDQAEDAMNRVAAAGWLRGYTALEFGSPHGGTWIPLLTERGFTTATSQADVVLDSFGIMHEPDQRSAFAQRARATAPDGVLLLQYHSLTTIVTEGQWNSLRHGHFAYYSMTALRWLLKAAGMQVVTAWEFDLYGGTVLLAAVHGDAGQPDDAVQGILATEDALGITDPAVVGGLQRSADRHIESLLSWLTEERAAGHTIFAYGAASRAVAVFSRAGIDSELVAAVADASPVKQGRRMPTTDVPIVSPDELVAAKPDRVFLTLPDLLPEVSARFPELDGRWKVDLSDSSP
jgi:hypothetical protein